MVDDTDIDVQSSIRGCLRKSLKDADQLGRLVRKANTSIPSDYESLAETSSVLPSDCNDGPMEILNSICMDHVRISEDARLVLTVVSVFLDDEAVQTVQSVISSNELCAKNLSHYLHPAGSATH